MSVKFYLVSSSDPIFATIGMSQIKNTDGVDAHVLNCSDLLLAIQEDEMDKALKIIECSDPEDLEESDGEGKTALHYAASKENETLCRALIRKMKDEDIRKTTNQSNETALSFAAWEDNKTFVNLLRELRPDLFKELAEMEDSQSQTPFHYSIKNRNVNISRQLSEVMSPHKICLPISFKDKKIPLLRTLVDSQDVELVKLVIGKQEVASELAKQTDEYGQTALHLSAWRGLTDITRLLCPIYQREKLLGVKTKDTEYTPLHFAAQGKQKETVQVIVDHMDKGDPLVGQVDKYGQTPLHWAAFAGELEICQTLLQKMTADQICTPMDPEERRQTALHFATQGGHLAVVQELLKEDSIARQLVGLPDKFGQTALHWAAGKNQPEICRILVKKMTSDEICALAGSSIHSRSALHIAAAKGDKEVVRTLVDNRQVCEKLLSIKNGEGHTALDLAKAKGFSEIAEILTPATTAQP